MIKRGRKEVEQTFVDNNFGGKGRMYITQFMGKDAALPQVEGFPDDFESSLNFFHELILEPGGKIGEHTHKGCEEIYFIAEGAGEMTVDGEVVALEAGDAVLTGNNCTHSFVATSEVPVKIYTIEAGIK